MLNCLLYHAWKQDVNILNDMVPIYFTSLLPVPASWAIRLLDPEPVFPQLSPGALHSRIKFFLPPPCLETWYVAARCLCHLCQKTFSGLSLSINAGYVWLMSSSRYPCLSFASQVGRLTGYSNPVFAFHLIRDCKTVWARHLDIREGMQQIGVD